MSKIFHHTTPLPAVAWPGGYAIRYLVTDHRRQSWAACAECATHAKHEALLPENRGSPETAAEVRPFVHWEGPAEECEGCGAELPSEYGEVQADERKGL